jgi:outer membrane protein assembly factor BamE
LSYDSVLVVIDTGVRVLSLRNKCRSQWLIGTVLVAALTTGCGSDRWGFPYKVGVQQGNWITQSQVELLAAGMTPEQVRFALGTPTLTSVLHANRWEYPYFYKSPSGVIEERNLSVFFSDGVLAKWVGDEQPTQQPFQIAKEEVDKSQAEAAQVKLDQERLTGPGGVLAIEPDINFSTIIDTNPSTDPGALPDVPDQTPIELN